MSASSMWSVRGTREFHMLRVAIREACAKEGRPLTEEATNIMAEVVDTAAAIALGRFSEKRENAIKEEDARKMSFIVHDFRTRLGAIALAVTEAVDAIPPDARTPEVMEPLATIERNVARRTVTLDAWAPPDYEPS